MVSFFEQIAVNQYLILENNQFILSSLPPSGSDYLKKFDLSVIAKICNKERDFDSKTYHNTIKTYRFVDIDQSKYDEHKLFEPHIYEQIVKYRLDMMNDFWRAYKNNNLFIKALKYYQDYGKKQYDLLRRLELQPINTTKGVSYLKFKDTRTGRLASSEDSEINIYNMSIADRYKIVAKPGHFLFQFDFVACQMRIYFLLTKHELGLQYDPYTKMSKDMNIHRQDAKLYSFKSLFGGKYSRIKRLSDSQNEYLANIFKNKIYKLNDCSIGSYIYNAFGRPVLVTSQSISVIMNNLMQCEERDLLMNSIVRVDEFIKSKNLETRILFPFHDASILSIPQNELCYIKEIRNIIEESKLGNMFSKISFGKNFGEMRAIADKRFSQQ
jgi:hypothetical protein